MQCLSLLPAIPLKESFVTVKLTLHLHALSFFPIFQLLGCPVRELPRLPQKTSCPKKTLLYTVGKNCTYGLALSSIVCRHVLACREPLQCWRVGFPKGPPHLCGSVSDRDGLLLLRQTQWSRVFQGGYRLVLSELGSQRRRLLRCAVIGKFALQTGSSWTSLHPPWSIIFLPDHSYVVCLSLERSVPGRAHTHHLAVKERSGVMWVCKQEKMNSGAAIPNLGAYI